ncbi:MAG: enoyl-CoA hydratase-related protein [Bacteroidia bacterium]|nr:enoyl-CoA hydratase-related protein [Bacteroidia bacterium]MCX7763861.1 enoyl-CoA hydratase-related protein [Bacteroidia bacterium]MDW8057704.1 enoyl-CoA hydratase-related protein [Bacteroidia bacterium]
MYGTLLYEQRDAVTYITLNRPERYNAFNEQMSAELLAALKEARKDKNSRVVVIRGAGKAFCSGQDLKDIVGVERSLGESVEKRYNPLVTALHELEKPVIASVNGVAAGAGAGLALACDYIIAARSASFVIAFVNVGLSLDTATSFHLVRSIGLKRAFALAALGDRLPAETAYEWGLVNQLVEDEKLEEATHEVALRFAAQAPRALSLIKKLLLRSFERSYEEALKYELYYQEIAGRTQDYKEGVQAFVEKRKPNFRGQ